MCSDALSVFSNQTPAAPIKVAECVAALKAAFPRMSDKDDEDMDFWTILTHELFDRRYSLERLRYIYRQAVANCKYGANLTISELLNFDKKVHVLTTKEIDALKIPHKPLAIAHIGDKWQVVWREDAEMLGVEFRPYKSTAEWNRDN